MISALYHLYIVSVLNMPDNILKNISNFVGGIIYNMEK